MYRGYICDSIEYLDQVNVSLGKIVREDIVVILYYHFINVDLNLSGPFFVILYSTKYEDKTRYKTSNLRAYLFKTYEDKIIQYLPTNTQ